MLQQQINIFTKKYHFKIHCISNICGVIIVLKLCEGALVGFTFIHILIEDDLQVQLLSLFGMVVKD